MDQCTRNYKRLRLKRKVKLSLDTILYPIMPVSRSLLDDTRYTNRLVE